MDSPFRWPFGRYRFRGLLGALAPQVLVLPREEGGLEVELTYTVPDRCTGDPCRLVERRPLDELRSREELDVIVADLLRSVLAHEVAEGFLVCEEPFEVAHP